MVSFLIVDGDVVVQHTLWPPVVLLSRFSLPLVSFFDGDESALTHGSHSFLTRIERRGTHQKQAWLHTRPYEKLENQKRCIGIMYVIRL